jgi:hypothetical protein
MEPWIFTGPESVRWIIEHLCVVDKSKARILVYNTTPRFAAWILPLHRDRLELVPGTATRAQSIESSWDRGSSFRPKAPILSFTMQQALDDTFRAQLAGVLNFDHNDARISFGSSAEIITSVRRTSTNKSPRSALAMKQVEFEQEIKYR